MRYLIDTTVLVPYFARDQTARDFLHLLEAEGIAVSILAYLEAYQGVVEDPDPAIAQQRFDAFFQGVPILPVSFAVAL